MFCILLYTLFSYAFSYPLTVHMHCTQSCETIDLNGKRLNNIGLNSSDNYNETLTFDANFGDIIATSIWTRSSKIAFYMWFSLAGGIYSTNDTNYITWDDQSDIDFNLPIPSGFNYKFIGKNPAGYDEIRFFYFEIPSLLTIDEISLKAIIGEDTLLSFDGKIRMNTKSKISVGDERGFFVLTQSLLYGKLYTADGTEIKSEQYIPLGDFVYRASTGPNIENIKYLLKNETTNFTVVYTIKTQICGEGCLTCDYNNETNYLTNHYCLSCQSGYYFKDTVETTCINDITKPAKYGLDKSTTPYLYKSCNIKCASCLEVGDDINHKCTSCIGAYLLIEGPNGKCLTPSEAASDNTLFRDTNTGRYYECTKKWYFTDDGDFSCTDTCPFEKSYVIASTLECVSMCPSPKVLVNNECVEAPQPIETDDDLFSITPIDSFINVNSSIRDIINIINKNPTKFLDLDANIKGDNFTVQIYNPNDPPEERDDISTIDLSQCEEILKKYYNFSSTEQFIIAKFDLYPENSIIPQVEYVIYSSNGTQFDISPCNSLNDGISYPTLNESNYDFELAETMLLNDIDVFNENDPFFNDVCYTFTDEGKDLTLGERQSKYFQGNDICEKGCTYKDFNSTSKKIKCLCTNKDELVITDRNQTKDTHFNSTSSVNNIKLFECFGLFTNDWEKTVNNPGFILVSSLVLVQSFSIGICMTTGFKSFLSSINSFTSKLIASNPPQKVSVDEIPSLQTSKFQNYFADFVVKKVKFDQTFNNKKQESSAGFHVKKELKKSYDNLLQLDETRNATSHFDEQSDCHHEYIKTGVVIPVKRANKIDLYNETSFQKQRKKIYKTLCLDVFWELFRVKNSFLGNFYPKNQFEIISLNISIYTLYLSLLFAINCMFYSDNIIRKYNANTIKDIDILLISLYSTLISYVLLKLIKWLMNFSIKITCIVQDKNGKDIILDKLTTYIASMKRKLILLFILEGVIMVCIWYYLTVFCIAFKSHQFNMILHAVYSFILSFFLSIVICGLLVSFEVIALKGNCKYCYYFFAILKTRL